MRGSKLSRQLNREFKVKFSTIQFPADYSVKLHRPSASAKQTAASKLINTINLDFCIVVQSEDWYYIGQVTGTIVWFQI